jgi:molybdopterin molybdotransferase
MYVTSGGVSLGDYDMVKDVLRAEGEIDIWQVRMKPGKPLAFGRVGDTPLLGLPGNPAAAWVSFLQFGRPAILRMRGMREVRLPEVDATLTERLRNAGRRRHYVRGVLSCSGNGYEARSTGDQGAALLSAAVRANCLIVVPETTTEMEPGSSVRTQVLGPLPM